MKNGLRLICYIFSMVSLCFAQIDEFGSRYREAAASLMKTDHAAALRLVDSLAVTAKTDEQRVMSYMLLASFHELRGELDKAILQASKADNIAKASFNFVWQSSTAVFLARVYRDIGLFTCSGRHLDQAEMVNEKQKEAAHYQTTKIAILHEKVLHAFEKEDYDTAMGYVLEAGLLIDLIKSDSSQLFLKAKNDQWAGVCHFYMGNMELADSLFSTALTTLLSIGDNQIIPYVYRWKAEIALANRQEERAFRYLEKASSYLTVNNVDRLKISIYKSYSTYYWKVGNVGKAKYFSEQSAKLKDDRDQMAKRISDNLIDNLSKAKESFKNRYVIAGMVALTGIILFFGALLYHVLLRKSERKGHFSAIESEGPKSGVKERSEQAKLPAKDLPVNGKEINISKETEERLLTKLQKYEEHLFFLTKNISLLSMAKELETNQRYISFLIRKYRGKDFYGYIQTSRIQYIISRMKADQSLLDIKLAQLAEMAGFPNQSKFSIAFKAETGFPPSAYIQFTKMEQTKEHAKLS